MVPTRVQSHLFSFASNQLPSPLVPVLNSGKFNSEFPYYQRPIFLCSAKKNENNIRQLMTDLIYPDTDKMTSEGFILADNEHVRIDIVRSMFDSKMAGILSGAGGASCQLCTATHDQLKDRELVIQGFPINRHISDGLRNVWRT